MHEISTATETTALLFTAGEAAKALRVSPRTLWALTNAGEIQAIRIGRSVRYDPADLRDWIASRKASAAST